MELNPKPLHGCWDEGFTQDRHVLSSDFIGYNEFGKAQFDSTRSDLGELLYKLKYQSDRSAIPLIGQAAADFVRNWNPGIDVIVPAPPSKDRAVQPLFEIADEVGKLLSLPVDKQSVRKIKKTPELKNLDSAVRSELLGGAHAVSEDALKGRRILLLDDLYQSGATLNTIGRLLREVGGVSAVFALALTRARS